MTEQIGKITLDYSHYPGQDLYCDGAVEDELLEIVKNYSRVEYPRIIEEQAQWPILYHLSSIRENIIDWIPFTKQDKVLEIGSGCGAITGALSGKAGSVTCVELSKKRSMINAYRNMDCENVTIHVGNFKDIEPTLPCDFDYICLIGVFEYGQSYMGTENPYEDFLCIVRKHLKENGRILIAIENKLGMKYFAGCREDHLGSYFSGIENYADGGGVRTFSRRGLERIFKNCGINQYHFYYPYPDYKLMTTLYSDVYLPGKGELCNNLRNFDRDRMLLFNEKNAFDGVVEDGYFPIFSNSYLVVLGDKFDVKYVKYSNDRAAEYAIRTEILRHENGKVCVRKYPLTPEANDHIRSMEAAYMQLKEKYDGSGLSVNRCVLAEGEIPYAEFEYVPGTTLSELFDDCLKREDQEGFRRLFREYVEKIGYNSQVPVSDFDLAFSNILINQDGWTVIDYEWTFGKAIETKELAFRAVYCYLLEDEKREKLDLDFVLSELSITEADADQYRRQEMDFQKFVTGQKRSMAEVRELLGHRVLSPQKWMEQYQDADSVERVQIYEDKGNGYSEEASYFVPDAYVGNGLIEFEISVSGDVHALRIDPAMDSCMVKIRRLLLNGERIPAESRKAMVTNGKLLKAAGNNTPADETGTGAGADGAEGGNENGPSIVFATKDPNISLRLDNLNRRAENRLSVKLEIVRIPPALARDMAGAVRGILR